MHILITNFFLMTVLTLQAYTDSDLNAPYSRTGGFFHLGRNDDPNFVNGPIMTISMLQPISTAAANEAEYVAMFMNGKTCLPIRAELDAIGYPQSTTLFKGDNRVAVPPTHSFSADPNTSTPSSTGSETAAAEETSPPSGSAQQTTSPICSPKPYPAYPSLRSYHSSRRTSRTSQAFSARQANRLEGVLGAHRTFCHIVSP